MSSPSKTALTDKRVLLLQQWFQQSIKSATSSELEVVSGDASFRRYFRGRTDTLSYILVDAPPDKEDLGLFTLVAEKLSNYGVNVPKVFAVDYEQGFMCLSDFGDDLIWERLSLSLQHNDAEADYIYQLAFSQLLKIQTVPVNSELPAFDAALLKEEMSLFQDWFCEKLLGMVLSEVEIKCLEDTFQYLINSAQQQPQVCVHRDYHSRNLIYQEDKPLGVIDFQDAVLGPVTYDLVSLLKDCYIEWPKLNVEKWVASYAQQAYEAGLIQKQDIETFLTKFNLMGMQRHLKVAGIFSRLYLRDHKGAYLADLPLTLKYLSEAVAEDENLQAFSSWLNDTVLPKVTPCLEQISLEYSEQTGE